MYVQLTVDIQEKKREKQFTYSLFPPRKGEFPVWNGLATALSLAPPCHAKPFVQSTFIDPNKGLHFQWFPRKKISKS